MNAFWLENRLLAASLIVVASIGAAPRMVAQAGAAAPQPSTATIAIGPTFSLRYAGPPAIIMRQWNVIEMEQDVVIASNAELDLGVCSLDGIARLERAGIHVLVRGTNGKFVPLPSLAGSSVRIAAVTRGAERHASVVFRFESQSSLREEDACLDVGYRIAPQE